MVGWGWLGFGCKVRVVLGLFCYGWNGVVEVLVFGRAGFGVRVTVMGVFEERDS